MSPRLPTPAEIADTPELAILAALQDTLEIALRALVATHPPLGDPECPAWVRAACPASEAADRILGAATQLVTALDEYQRAVELMRDQDIESDFPF